MLSKRKAAIILLLEGLASSGLQMICIRQTVPYVGSSVLTTSIVISCFLAALALGYFWGGKKTSDNYHRALTINLVASIGLFGIGFSYAFVAPFFELLMAASATFSPLANPLVQLFVFCIVIMCPLVFCLGQTVPLLLHTAHEDTSKSEATGNATALSTIGNVIGALLTSLVLMYYLGVGHSIFINCLILAVCLAFILRNVNSQSILIVVSSSALLFVSYYLNVMIPERLFVETTPYSNYQITDDDRAKTIVINRSRASYIDKETQQGWPYIEILKTGLFHNNAAGKDVLVLGAGGFTLSAQQDFGAHFTYVDIDPAIRDIAEQHFLEKEIEGHFVAYDARSFLKHTDQQWDIIVVDLYTNAATIPMHTLTYEFFQLVGAKLKSDGTAAINIATDPTLQDTYARRVDHTIRQALSRCVSSITNYDGNDANIIYFCGPQEESTKPLEVYRDNTTEVAIDSYISTM